MPAESRVRFIRKSLLELAEALYRDQQISRERWLAIVGKLRSQKLITDLARQLYGPHREANIPDLPGAKLALLPLKKIGKGRFNLLVFKGAEGPPIRCLVGHRFTKEIEETFQWNLRHLFELFGIVEDYSGFDGAAVNIIDDLRKKIDTYDFCLFDNRETTRPSKPNVYIEAGMAFALRRPFIFCHYKKEVWPSDFSNVFYISYRSYKELFQQLYAKLPIFLRKNVEPHRAASNRF